MADSTMLENEVKPKGMSEKEFMLIRELVKTRLESNQELEYESFEGYELPPRIQFSMLKKPAVSIKDGKMTFNMAAIRMFEGVQYVLPMVNKETKRMAIVPCAEEESASVEWARIRAKDEAWVNKTISSRDFLQAIYNMMGWSGQNRYKILGRVANSERGLILVFEMEEAITFEPRKEKYVDEKTGETKERQVKNYPDKYKDRIGQTYEEYKQSHLQEKFEEVDHYSDSIAEDEAGSISTEAVADVVMPSGQGASFPVTAESRQTVTALVMAPTSDREEQDYPASMTGTS
ncbi:MAG: hypothetical protein IJ682_00525 [Lachnospiraceae bacterium]|nr:hypothetical protein [Lachnospiraceae bacterium]